MSEIELDDIVYETIAKMDFCGNTANEFLVEIASKIVPEIEKLLKLRRPQNKHFEQMELIVSKLKKHVEDSEKIKTAVEKLSKIQLDFKNDNFMNGVFLLVKIETEMSLENYINYISEQLKRCDEFYSKHNIKVNDFLDNTI